MKSEIEKLREEFNRRLDELEKRNSLIEVPENIHIAISAGNSIGIVSENSRFLFYSKTHRDFLVTGYGGCRRLKAYLRPCAREELQAGDIAFFTDNAEPPTLALYKCAVILDQHRYVRYEQRSVDVYNYAWKHWYKVIFDVF